MGRRIQAALQRLEVSCWQLGKTDLVALSWLLAAGILLLLACGCGTFPMPTATASPSDTPTPTSLATKTPSPTATPTITDTGLLTLTLWYPEQLAPSDDQPGGKVLKEQYQAFEEMYPNLRIKGIRKKAHGPGGLLDYLYTTSRVLPEDLPDLIALDIAEVAQAAEAGLFQPLDDLLPEELLQDLLLADVGKHPSGRIAIPYEVDVRFLAYDRTAVDPVPKTWEELLASKGTYLLPLGEQNSHIADIFLLQYHALGGRWEDALPTLDETKLADILDFYNQGLANGVIHAASLTITTLSECWQVYTAGEAAMVETTARQYRADGERLEKTQYAPIPTKNGNIATLGEGWAWCLVTADPERQQAAIALLLWLMEEENLAARCMASLYLPSRSNVLENSMGDQAYAAFLRTLLDHAFFRPSSPEYPAVANLIHIALQDVLAGNATAEEAAWQIKGAIERLRQGKEPPHDRK